MPVRSPAMLFKQCSSGRAARPPGHPRTRGQHLQRAALPRARARPDLLASKRAAERTIGPERRGCRRDSRAREPPAAPGPPPLAGVRAHDAARRGASGAAPASSPPAAGVVAAVGVSPAASVGAARRGAGRLRRGRRDKGEAPRGGERGPPLQLVILSREQDVREARARCRCGETAGSHRGGSCRAGSA